jgi:uncharacterized cupredoxin-like copper-binding protein
MKREWFLFNVLRIVRRLALAAAMAGAVCAPAFADGSVKVDLWEKPDGTQGITLSAGEVKAGKVTFAVTNTSNVMEHEFLIVKTDMAFEQFPVKRAGAKVDEDKLKGMKEFGEIREGKTKKWTATLKPGRYVLFCNEEGHFAAGMRTTLTVTP